MTVVACLHVAEYMRDVIHWVACIKADGRHGDGASQALVDEGASDEETMTFHAKYLSVGCVIIVMGADGDCGNDVQCRMLCAKRCAEARQCLRSQLADFSSKHIGKRVFVSCMYALSDVS